MLHNHHGFMVQIKCFVNSDSHWYTTTFFFCFALSLSLFFVCLLVQLGSAWLLQYSIIIAGILRIMILSYQCFNVLLLPCNICSKIAKLYVWCTALTLSRQNCQFLQSPAATFRFMGQILTPQQSNWGLVEQYFSPKMCHFHTHCPRYLANSFVFSFFDSAI